MLVRMRVAAFFHQKYVEQVQKSFNEDVGMGCTMPKIVETREIPLAILSSILAQSCVTPPYIIKAKGLHMIVLVYLIVLLGGFPLFPRFFAWCIPSLHPHSFIFALLYINLYYTYSVGTVYLDSHAFNVAITGASVNICLRFENVLCDRRQYYPYIESLLTIIQL